MTGYQEVLTDPSYKGQIVAMTYPLIGNYGVNARRPRIRQPQVEGFVVRELTRMPSNFRSQATLDDYLRAAGVLGIEGIDTRALVRRLRVRGTMNGVLSTTDLDDASLVHKARTRPGIVGRDLVREVVPPREFGWSEGFVNPLVTYLPSRPPTHHVVALDFGMKHNILRCLVQVGCKVTVLPGTATADDVLAHKPDGIFLSNGPGDPEPLGYAIETVSRLAGKKPIFGICLGHQLCGLALGGKTFKLKFGHRGANQPVLEPAHATRSRSPRRTTASPCASTTCRRTWSRRTSTSTTRRWRDAPPPLPAVQRAVPSRGVGRPARQRLPLRGVPPADGMTPRTKHE